jgi:fructose-1,6-bisphosphatase/inositol monophosphatase family enzyme
MNEEYLKNKKILFEAGEILKKKFNNSFSYNNKGKYDLVSDADKEIETFLINNLSEYYPNTSFYSEEAGEINKKSEYRWIIDPLDGTANFIFGVPYFNISLALEYDNKIIEGYVYNPINNELYYSNNKIKKSYLNENEICVSDTKTISNSLIVFGYSANYNNIEKYYERWHIIFDNCKKGMGLLSPALNICNVARGRIDCFIDFGSSMEGQAAGALILKNAGGVMFNYDLTEWDYKIKGIIAINNNLKEEICNRLV